MMSDDHSNPTPNDASGSNEPKPNNKAGRRKDGKPFKEGNTRPDGSYEVGRNRTSKATRFAKNDGRKRGKREKGTPNFETVFNIEANRIFSPKIDGETVKLSAIQTATLMAFHLANKERRLPAIALVMDHARRFLEKAERKPVISQESDAEIIEQWLGDLLAGGIGPGTITDDLTAGDGEAVDDRTAE